MPAALAPTTQVLTFSEKPPGAAASGSSRHRPLTASGIHRWVPITMPSVGSVMFEAISFPVTRAGGDGGEAAAPGWPRTSAGGVPRAREERPLDDGGPPGGAAPAYIEGAGPKAALNADEKRGGVPSGGGA